MQFLSARTILAVFSVELDNIYRRLLVSPAALVNHNSPFSVLLITCLLIFMTRFIERAEQTSTAATLLTTKPIGLDTVETSVDFKV